MFAPASWQFHRWNSWDVRLLPSAFLLERIGNKLIEVVWVYWGLFSFFEVCRLVRLVHIVSVIPDSVAHSFVELQDLYRRPISLATSVM